MAAGSLTTGKVAEVMFEETLETYEKQDSMLKLTTFSEPDPASMQNSGNVIWKGVRQHAPIIEGWDLTGEETGIIKETYPCLLGTPKNDYVGQRADDMRDMQFWKERGMVSGMQQATELNQAIANTLKIQSSMFYRSNATSGYDFIGEAQALMNERQGFKTTRQFVLNDRSNLTFAKDLAGRQTVQGRPETVWEQGQIGNNIAQFDVFTGSFLPNLAGGASPDTTVTGDQSFKPEGGSVDQATGVVTNIDYRSATLPVADSSSYNVGDKVTIDNGGAPIAAVGLSDKTNTGQAMTFTIVAKPSGTSVTVYPKPIALDDAALSTLEKAYANVDTTISDGAVLTRLNTSATAKTNFFFDKDAIEVTGGTIPSQLFSQFAGMKTLTQKLSNGLTMYMVYDGNINDLSFRYRLFTWYGVTVRDPSRCGVAELF